MDADWESLSRSSSSSSGGDDHDDGISGGGIVHCRRSSFSYRRLPHHQLCLSILKLDGTYFDVKIPTTGTVSDLKTAVEDVFRDLPEGDGGPISWAHVWGHFCLCYEDHKLVDEKALLKDYAIKDGDQLRFIRHLPVNTSSPKKSPKKLDSIVEHDVMRQQMGPDEHTIPEEDISGIRSDDDSPCSQDELCPNFDRDSRGDTETTIAAARTEFRLVQMIRSWLARSRLVSPRKSERAPKPAKYY